MELSQDSVMELWWFGKHLKRCPNRCFGFPADVLSLYVMPYKYLLTTEEVPFECPIELHLLWRELISAQQSIKTLQEGDCAYIGTLIGSGFSVETLKVLHKGCHELNTFNTLLLDIEEDLRVRRINVIFF